MKHTHTDTTMTLHKFSGKIHCCSYFPLLIVSFIIIVVTGKMLFRTNGEFEGDETTPQILIEKHKIILTHSSHLHADTKSIFKQVQACFLYEPSVEFMMVNDDRLVFPEIKHLSKIEKDFSCLVKPPFPPDPIKTYYKGDLTNPAALLSFVNQMCHTFRKMDGSLSELGLETQKLERSLHQIQVDESCASIDASNLDRETFLHDYVLKQIPVVIKNLPQEWITGNWSVSFFEEFYGKKKVHVKAAIDGNFEGVEPIEKWADAKGVPIPPQVSKGLTDPNHVVVRPAAIDMNLTSFLSHLQTQRQDRQCKKDLKEGGRTSMYIEYLSMESYFPKLLENIQSFPWADFFIKDVVNLWFGDGQTIGKLHFDPFDNILAMIKGTKKFVLFDPSQSSNLYEGHLREAMLEFSDDDNSLKFLTRTKLLDSTSMVNSPIDINNPDLSRFPAFANSTALTCEVRENEALYLPSYWWHEVESQPNEMEGQNIAVNFWYTPIFEKKFPCALCKKRFNFEYLHLFSILKDSMKGNA